MKKMNKKAFTLIELLVVVAVIGILVLLGAPRFTSYVQDAQLTRIQQDIKVMEQEVGAVIINNDDDFNSWENNSKNFNQLIQENKLFERKGPVAKGGEPIDGPYKVIPEKYKNKINTKLKGTFYANSGGEVYYEHVKSLSGISAEPVGPVEKEPVYSDEEIQDLIAKGYIPIATAEELDSIRSSTPRTYGKGTKWKQEYTGGLDKKYIQVANVDLSIYSVEGWNPIGDNSDSSSRFTGTYDGGNYVITGLVVKGEGKNSQGLFGYTSGATIRNVGLIDNKVTGAESVGGLVGLADSSTTISNSYATGSVTGDDSVGGLVGYAWIRSTISNSYATGSVTGSGIHVGGLVGVARSSTTISNSYATGSVESTGSEMVGGLVGWAQNSTIENSYATGSVESTGSKMVGGLVGWARDSTIINSYATGEVTGQSSVGGLVGWASSSTITSSYWNKETTGQARSSGGGEGKTTDEMKNRDTYSGWDFTNIWEIIPRNYPKLR